MLSVSDRANVKATVPLLERDGETLATSRPVHFIHCARNGACLP
jgi:hemoglobin-like flavoprotein